MPVMRLVAAAAAALGLWAGGAVAQDAQFFSFGAGDSEGGYYAAASAICDAVNRAGHGTLRCSPESTLGSIYNIAMLSEGELEFAFVQSDWQRAAWQATDRFFGEPPMADLRSVMSLYPETVTILAAPGSQIVSSVDLPGKRVDIGLQGSGRNATVMELLNRLSLGTEVFSEMRELPNDESISALCGGRIDAAIFIVGHPSALIAEALSQCHVRIVPFDGPLIREVLADAPDFRPIRIDAGTYPEMAQSVSSQAVYATVVTLASADADLVQMIVSSLLAARDQIGRQSPLLAGLDPAQMRRAGLTAPLHPGAAAAFDAAGFAGD